MYGSGALPDTGVVVTRCTSTLLLAPAGLVLPWLAGCDDPRAKNTAWRILALYIHLIYYCVLLFEVGCVRDRQGAWMIRRVVGSQEVRR